MDNLCHTLVGAALGEAGLKRRTALAMPTLMIGANFPDLDVIAVPLGYSLEFRRGWTHGVLALALLPFLLTGIMLLWDRWVRRRGGRDPGAPVLPGQILLLATLSILTHPTLDWLNTYGMRWLMPFEERWFYGDAVFIIDPWMWLALAVGVVAARRGRREWPARLALGGVAGYAALMLITGWIGRSVVAARAQADASRVAALMVGPVPITPFRRSVVVDVGDAYRFGTLAWSPGPEVALEEGSLPKNWSHPAVHAAAATPEARGFQVWARFPYYTVRQEGDFFRVRMDDARYAGRGGRSFAGVEVRIPVEKVLPHADPVGRSGAVTALSRP